MSTPQTQINVTFTNKTSKVLNYKSMNEHHGKFTSGPTSQIYASTDDQKVFTIEHSTWDENGSTGWVQYQISDGTNVYIYFNFPLEYIENSYSGSMLYFYACLQYPDGTSSCPYYLDVSGVDMQYNPVPAQPDIDTPLNATVTLYEI